mmetsp:Transcript_975/g.2694  ORF Transcript_975/g.2694 Transcript_975/m.2694 type:complete len:201 (+) Transcript_975:571-1173(+)
MDSSMSRRPQRKPMPVGPHILWPDATIQSTPSAWTSTGMCGTDWHASKSTLAPTARAAATTAGTGSSQPSTLDTCGRATSLVLSPRRERRCARSMHPASVSIRAYLTTAPVRCARSCQGTMLAWCSTSLTTISSPGPTLSRPHECATRLMASVAPRVKTISRRDAALTNCATLSRAPSYASVARTERAWAPRCTLALSRS